jgi:hypothetical protein
MATKTKTPAKPKKPSAILKNRSFVDEMGTRMNAGLIKLSESPVFGGTAADAKKYRSKEDQLILNKDLAIHKSNSAEAKKKAAAAAKARAEVKAMQNKPGAYKQKLGGVTKMKTGGMVNSNAKIVAIKRATGKVGGISKSPKTAIPKAKMGGSKGKC